MNNTTFFNNKHICTALKTYLIKFANCSNYHIVGSFKALNSLLQDMKETHKDLIIQSIKAFDNGKFKAISKSQFLKSQSNNTEGLHILSTIGYINKKSIHYTV